MSNPLVSIIVVDYKKKNPYLVECLDAIQKQTYKNFEIILVTDYPVTLPARPSCHSDRSGGIFSSPRFIKKSFGHYVGPAQKRDWGAKKAAGEILAFIDDDAYPTENWLKNMVKSFTNSDTAAVGGPGMTPPGVSWREEASGWMSASPLGAGLYNYRFQPAKKTFVDDYPSMNLAVRRPDFLEIGGFDSHYWPGEDTKLCLDLVSKLKKKIIYDPKVSVYHHRRPIWIPHLRQNGSFGLHRGFFARLLPQTSLRPVYFGPPLLLLGLLYLALSLLFPILSTKYYLLTTAGWLLLATYLLALAVNSIWIYRKSQNLFQGILSFFVVFITHLWYGARFLQGFLLTRKLTR